MKHDVEVGFCECGAWHIREDNIYLQKADVITIKELTNHTLLALLEAHLCHTNYCPVKCEGFSFFPRNVNFSLEETEKEIYRRMELGRTELAIGK